MTVKAPCPITADEARAIAYDLSRVECRNGGVFLRIERARERMTNDAWERFLTTFATERRAVASGRMQFDENVYPKSRAALTEGLRRQPTLDRAA